MILHGCGLGGAGLIVGLNVPKALFQLNGFVILCLGQKALIVPVTSS